MKVKFRYFQNETNKQRKKFNIFIASRCKDGRDCREL